MRYKVTNTICYGLIDKKDLEDIKQRFKDTSEDMIPALGSALLIGFILSLIIFLGTTGRVLG